MLMSENVPKNIQIISLETRASFYKDNDKRACNYKKNANANLFPTS